MKTYDIDRSTGLIAGLPSAIAEHRGLIEPRDCVFFDYSGAKASGPLASKIGGLPYWPKERPWPLGSEGQKLTFLAQVNLGELPSTPPGFPTEGMLQFFIDPDGEYYGAYQRDEEIGGPDAQVIYHPGPLLGPEALARQLPALVDEETPLECEDEGMCFEAGVDFPPVELVGEPPTPERNPPFLGLGASAAEIAKGNALKQAYRAALVALNHPKVGGYPCFFNGHPGMHDAALYDYDQVLLQLPSSGGVLTFGSYATAVFMIKSSDLAARDFSRVFFSIDG